MGSIRQRPVGNAGGQVLLAFNFLAVVQPVTSFVVSDAHGFLRLFLFCFSDLELEEHVRNVPVSF